MRNCITRTFSRYVGHFSTYNMATGALDEVGTVECKAGKKVDAKKMVKLANAKWSHLAGTLICTKIEQIDEKRYMTEENFIKYSLVMESDEDAFEE